MFSFKSCRCKWQGSIPKYRFIWPWGVTHWRCQAYPQCHTCDRTHHHCLGSLLPSRLHPGIHKLWIHSFIGWAFTVWLNNMTQG
jgi:hypothetical protein